MFVLCFAACAIRQLIFGFLSSSEFIFVRRLRLSAVSVSLPSPFVRRLQLIVRRLRFSAVSVCPPSSADFVFVDRRQLIFRQLVICLVSAVSLHTVFTVVHDPLFSAANHCFVSC